MARLFRLTVEQFLKIFWNQSYSVMKKALLPVQIVWVNRVF